MEEKLYEYILEKIAELANYSISYSENEIEKVFQVLLNAPGSINDKIQRVCKYEIYS